MRRVWVNLNRKSWFGLKAGTGDQEAIRQFRVRWTVFSEEVVALTLEDARSLGGKAAYVFSTR